MKNLFLLKVRNIKKKKEFRLHVSFTSPTRRIFKPNKLSPSRYRSLTLLSRDHHLLIPSLKTILPMKSIRKHRFASNRWGYSIKNVEIAEPERRTPLCPLSDCNSASDSAGKSVRVNYKGWNGDRFHPWRRGIKKKMDDGVKEPSLPSLTG